MTLKDIAKEAGVSTVTVSNVINGNYRKVSKETIEKVNKIIDARNYHPNATARSLAAKKSRIIAVVLPDLGDGQYFSESPYYTEIMSCLEREIRNRGYYMMIRCVGACREVIPLFLSWNVDGIIFLGAYKDEVEEIVPKLDCPAVYIDTYASDLPIANVGINDYKGGYLATRYLIGRGHTSIAWAGPDYNDPGVINERYKGFLDACTEKGIEVSEQNCFVGMTSFEQGVKLGEKIAFSSVKYTAVVCMSDILAFGIMDGLRRTGVIVPDDISVVGFDNIPACSYSNPQLTTVSQNIREKAELSAKVLFDMITEDKKIVTNEHVDVEIVERQSVKSI
ncbi:LacI family DNA-binding transcriptional regulator [Butyrivibrio sp. MC2013]|uniref:LacI family DNA-binding transcriptional regulator n=1 Tax=Butyrivibrio sp. MC2013 TaxID=1280686 RepID=UPI00041D1306|nr:LacI family DNA-binding transcriptional regulator [Butyrivibrio sp. MC2013]